MSPADNQALLIAAFVFLPGAVSALTWRNMSGIRPATSVEERTAGLAVWSAINGAVMLVLWGAIGPRIEALLANGGTVPERLALAGLVLVVPFAIALSAGYVSRFPRVRDWLQRNGIVHAEASPPWDRLTAPRGDTSPGFYIYFEHVGLSYRCAAARSSKEQILGRDVYVHDDERGWVEAKGITGVLLVNFGERVLFFEEDEPI